MAGATRFPPAGTYGGVVRRRFQSAGVTFEPGAEISVELAATWPVTNRLGLGSSGMVYWYQAPDGADRDLQSIVVRLPDGTEHLAVVGRESDGALVAIVTVPPTLEETKPSPSRKGAN